jgi:hypothetical protein
MEFLLLLCAIAVIFFLMFKFGKIVENFSAKQNGGFRIPSIVSMPQKIQEKMLRHIEEQMRIVQQTTYTYNGSSIDLDCNTATSWPECLIKDKDGKCSPREQEQRKLLENIKNVKCTLQQVRNDIGSAVSGYLSSVQSKISGCMGKGNGDCNSCSYEVWYPGYPCCKDTCGPWWARYGCDCHSDCERGWKRETLDPSTCEASRHLRSFACNAFNQIPKWNC